MPAISSIDKTPPFSKNKKTGKTVFNLFGTDDRRKKAEELKMCCNAFDIGE